MNTKQLESEIDLKITENGQGDISGVVLNSLLKDLLENLLPKTKVTEISELTDIPAATRFKGMTVYVEEDESIYYLKNNLTTFKKFDSSDLTNIINNHIDDKVNPHETTLEKARQQDSNMEGHFTMEAEQNLPNASGGKIPIGFVKKGGLSFLTYKNEFGDKDTPVYEIKSLCKNTSGSTISRLTPVYITSSDGDIPIISKSSSNNYNSVPSLGLTTNEVFDGELVKVISKGVLTGVNTTSYNAGDILYISQSGDLTSSKPNDGNVIQKIAVVLNSDESGSIFVNVFNTKNDSQGSVNEDFYFGNFTNDNDRVLRFLKSSGVLQLKAEHISDIEVELPTESGKISLESKIKNNYFQTKVVGNALETEITDSNQWEKVEFSSEGDLEPLIKNKFTYDSVTGMFTVQQDVDEFVYNIDVVITVEPLESQNNFSFSLGESDSEIWSNLTETKTLETQNEDYTFRLFGLRELKAGDSFFLFVNNLNSTGNIIIKNFNITLI